MSTPGSMLCATVSPTNVFFLKKLKLPTAPDTPPNNIVANATYRTLGS